MSVASSSSQEDAGTNNKTSSLLDEIAVLRKRIRDYEERDDSGSGGSSNSSVAADASLRKELADSITAKAEMEMEYLNMMAKLEKDKECQIEELTQKLQERDEEREQLMQKAVETEEHLVGLSDEINLQREQMEKEISMQQLDISNLEEEVYTRESIITEQRNEIVELQGNLKEVTIANKDLQEEVDDLLCRANQSKQLITDLEEKVRELSRVSSASTKPRDSDTTKIASLTTRACDAEKDAADATKEWQQQREEMEQEIATNLKDMERIKQELSSRDSMMEEQKEALEHLQQTVTEKSIELEKVTAQKQCATIDLEKARLELTDLKFRMVDLTTQRISYEKRTSKNILDQASQVDDLGLENQALREENKRLKLKFGGDANGKKRNPLMEQAKHSLEAARHSGSLLDTSTSHLDTSGIDETASSAAANFNKACGISPVMAAISKYEQLATKRTSPDSPSSKQAAKEVEELKLQVKSLREKLKKEENQVTMLSQEIIELNDEQRVLANCTPMPDPTKQIEALQAKIASLEKQLQETFVSSGGEEETFERLKLLQEHLDNECKRTEQLSQEVKQLKKDLEKESNRAKALLAENESLKELREEFETQEVQQLKENLEKESNRAKALLAENESLKELREEFETQEVQQLKENLEKESNRAKALLVENESLKESRDDFETQLRESFDKRIDKNRKIFDGDVEKLRVEVREMQRRSKETEEDFLKQLEDLEEEKKREWEELQSEIDELCVLLDEKDAELLKLKKDMGSLRETASALSRSEAERLRAELKTTVEVNDTQSFQIKEMIKKHEAAIADYRDQISALHQDIAKMTPMSTKAQKYEKAYGQLKEENRALNERVSALSDGRRLVNAAKEKDGVISQLQQRNTTLKKEVERLTRRLKHLESSITRISI